MPNQTPLLLLVLGEAPEPVRRAHGPFASWYERAAAEPLVVHDGRLGRLVRHVTEFAGILISGSAASLADPEPASWMDEACELVVRAHDAGVPVLGVCFGHQLIGRAFGGKVIANPRGFEIGTEVVELTEEGRADRLFDGVPKALRANLTHYDVVVDPPERMRTLARNDQTDIQALAVSEHIRGVQFHPEITGDIMRAYVDARRAILSHRDPDALIAEAADCPDALQVIHNFRRHFVARS